MDLLTFLLIGGAIGYVIYLFFEDGESDLLEKRLMKFSQQKENKEEENKETKLDLKQKLLLLVEPMIYEIMKRRKDIKSMKQMLIEAGLPSDNEDVFRLMTKKVFFAVAGLLLALFLMAGNKDPNMKLMLCIIVPMSCYRLPNFSLKRMAKVRSDEITYNLPDALDLLTVCVEAGLGLDAALSRVAQEQARTSPILARELGRVSKDVLAGVPRQEAFRNLSLRNNVPDLKTFAALLIQTDKLGTSIAQSLRTYSDTVRTKRKQRVEALAAQASVKMIIPLVLFILPAMFIVLLAPAAINLIQNFKNTGL